MNRASLGAIAIATALLATSAAAAAERPLVLELVINGRATGKVGEFIDRDGKIYASPSELHALGFVLPRGIAPDALPIALASLPNVQATVNEAKQTLVVLVSDAALLPRELHARRTASLAPLSRSEYGALLNYDTSVTFSGEDVSGGALAEARIFSPHGVLETSALLSIKPPTGRKNFIRLDTTFTHTQSGKMRRWRVGDIVTGALPWTRAVRLGGAQVASDFSVRPDLITHPLPEISASAAVPSTVNVVVNGIQQLSEAVEPGPFVVRSLPVVTGAGDVSVAVMDALGRQVMLTLPFYASTSLLRRGLASYSVEAGMIRHDYAQSSDNYSGWAASQSSRFGLTDWLTVESHAEATKGLIVAGVGATMLVGKLGVANVAVAASRGGQYGSGGTMVTAAFQRISRGLSLSVSGSMASGGFSDIAAEHGASLPKSTLNANFGYQLGAWGSLGMAYNRRVPRAEVRDRSSDLPWDDIPEPQRVELITASYSVPLAGLGTLYGTGFKDLREKGAYGVGIGFSFAVGKASFATVEGSFDSGEFSGSASLAKSAQEPGEFGFRLLYSEGVTSHHSAEGELLAGWGRVSGGLDHREGRISGRGGARGAIVLAGGDLFFSDQIHDSFAVVSTGDVGGVPILYQNRSVGKTNARGKLLIYAMLSYQDNRVTVDSTLLPPDIEVGETERLVRPPDRSGVRVDFKVRKVRAAMLTLHDRQGIVLPPGSVAKVDGVEDRPVGYDGQVYVTGLKAANRMTVVLPDGAECSVQFAYKPLKGDVPVIGPLRCQ